MFSKKKKEKITIKSGSSSAKYRQIKIYQFIDRFSSLLAFLILVIVVGVSYVYLLGPKITAINGVQSDFLAKQDQELAILQAQEDKLRVEINKYKDLEKLNLTDLDQVLPLKAEKLKIFVEINDLMARHGFKVTNLEISEGSLATELELPDSLQALNIAVGVTGRNDIVALRNLLSGLEKNKRLLNLVEFDLGLLSEKEDESEVAESISSADSDDALADAETEAEVIAALFSEAESELDSSFTFNLQTYYLPSL